MVFKTKLDFEDRMHLNTCYQSYVKLNIQHPLNLSCVSQNLSPIIKLIKKKSYKRKLISCHTNNDHRYGKLYCMRIGILKQLCRSLI